MPRGRKRVHASEAARQAAHRERVGETSQSTKLIIAALTRAFDEGGCPWVVNRLPDNERQATDLLCARLSRVKLVAFQKEPVK